VTSQSPDMQKSMKIIWEHLLPGMQSGVLPENGEEQATLKKELSALVLPVVKGSKTSAISSRYHKKKWTVEPNDLPIKSLEFSFSGKGCVLSVASDTSTSTLEFGWENWILNRSRELYIFRAGDMVPKPTRIAGTATWVDDHTLQLNLRFVEAIFGDRLTCVFGDDGVTVTFLNSVAETAVKKTVDPRKPLIGRGEI
ncbi:MAG: hypothetical protein ABUL46_00485, partial [Chitinophaga rupis]